MSKILIVDDEPPIIDVLSYNLKQAGYEVVIARDGEQAVAAARRDKPDLIILDLMLPKLDGLEVHRIVRRESEMPVIMLTARDAEIDRVVGLELGADDYVVKPFSVRELIARVKNVLRRSIPRPITDSPDRLEVGESQHRRDTPRSAHRIDRRWNSPRWSSPCCTRWPATPIKS